MAILRVKMVQHLWSHFYFGLGEDLLSARPSIMEDNLTVVYWPAFPDDPQTTGDKVASVFETSVSLFVYLFTCLCVLGKFSNFSPHPPLSPLLLISKIFSVMNKKYTFPE